jgi:hypothetical protein
LPANGCQRLDRNGETRNVADEPLDGRFGDHGSVDHAIPSSGSFTPGSAILAVRPAILATVGDDQDRSRQQPKSEHLKGGNALVQHEARHECDAHYAERQMK